VPNERISVRIIATVVERTELAVNVDVAHPDSAASRRSTSRG